MRRALIGALVLSSLATPAVAQVTQEDVAGARAELEAVQDRLSGEVARYEEAVSEQAVLADRLEGLRLALTDLERDLVLARLAARERAAEMYMTEGAGLGLVATGDADWAPARYVYLESVAQTDREVLVRLEVVRRDYREQAALVDEANQQNEALLSEISLLVDSIYGELEQANQAYRQVKDQWEAQEAARIQRELEEQARLEAEAAAATSTTTTPTTTAGSGSTGSTTTVPTTSGSTAPPVTTTTVTMTTVPTSAPGTRVCPVDGATTFVDSWGAPRPGGRSHSGTDLLAALGTPLVAIEAGYIVNPNWHSAGGRGLYVDGDSGDLWYYAHMDGYASGIVDGARVEAGQRVGYVGQTGNATTPHLHLGWQPGGGALQNPFSVVDALC
jgi:murein DD-endopeptidase MepM/ murein hydrolase activator NlpD